MKKFSDIHKEQTNITDKNYSLDFKKGKDKNTSNDIKNLNDQLDKQVEGTKLEGEWEIVSVIDVSLQKPTNIEEALIINAEVGTHQIKRGELIYITAQIKKPGQSQAYHQSQMGCIKVRVVDIYNTMLVLNNLK
jgi:hypothetical protein